MSASKPAGSPLVNQMCDEAYGTLQRDTLNDYVLDRVRGGRSVDEAERAIEDGRRFDLDDPRLHSSDRVVSAWAKYTTCHRVFNALAHQGYWHTQTPGVRAWNPFASRAEQK